jgi:hypothetical protein
VLGHQVLGIEPLLLLITQHVVSERITRARAPIERSARLSCTNPITALITVTLQITAASRSQPVSALTAPVISRA